MSEEFQVYVSVVLHNLDDPIFVKNLRLYSCKEYDITKLILDKQVTSYQIGAVVIFLFNLGANKIQITEQYDNQEKTNTPQKNPHK